METILGTQSPCHGKRFRAGFGEHDTDVGIGVVDGAGDLHGALVIDLDTRGLAPLDHVARGEPGAVGDRKGRAGPARGAGFDLDNGFANQRQALTGGRT